MIDKNHLRYLDCFRGIAVCGVILTHVVWFSGAVTPILDNVMHFGSKGVQLFFLVSGLTLSLNYGGKEIDRKKFFIKRFFRIAPMYYLATFAYILIGVSLLPQVFPKDVSIFSAITALTFTNGWFVKSINSFSPGAWSISAEFMFYLVFPFLVKLINRKLLCLFVLVVSFVFSVVLYKAFLKFLPGPSSGVEYFAYFFWMVQLPAFMSGICIAAWMPDLQKIPKPFAAAVFYFSLLGIGIASCTRGVTSSYIAADILFSLAVASGAVYRGGPLRSSALSYIGNVSFSIYLVHFFFIRLLEVYFHRSGPLADPNVAAIFCFFAVLIFALVVSSFTYRFVEINGKKLGDIVAKRLVVVRRGERAVV